jgi:hypothetical protein
MVVKILNSKWKPKLYWKYGVILEDVDALLKITLNAPENTIQLRGNNFYEFIISPIIIIITITTKLVMAS